MNKIIFRTVEVSKSLNDDYIVLPNFLKNKMTFPIMLARYPTISYQNTISLSTSKILFGTKKQCLILSENIANILAHDGFGINDIILLYNKKGKD